MAGLPTGTVTFLFTDLEGSTRLWEQWPAAMRAVLARHDQLLRDAVEAQGGQVVKTTGDGVHAVFATAPAAIAAAAAAQHALAGGDWPETGPLPVRMGLHTGAAEIRNGDYYGTVLNRAARLMSAAHGGQIVVSHAAEEVAAEALPAGLSLRDLGEHRLRDLSKLERVFQLVGAGLTDEFPPLRSLDAFPGNLPLQLTSFIGRGAEVEAVMERVLSARLVTLTGVGGVGKTRLALQAAAELLPEFREGAWLCELAAADDAVAMLQVIATALEVRSRAGLSLEASVLDFLHARRLLLVLDNCEHLLEAAAGFAEGLLGSCPDVRLLATSRELLGVAGEQAIGVRPLPVPKADDLGGADEAIRLFAERAAAVRSDFAVDATNRAAVVDICRRLDGIPLAIELAAARVGAMSPADISSRLDERFRLLAGGRRRAVERQQTLRGAVDWSYSLLEQPEQVLFDRLGVFAGSFDAAAVEAITASEDLEAWDALDALTGLVNKSMVITEETGGEAMRYRLLETLRQYARERLDATDDADRWWRRYAQHYTRFAERAGQGTLSPDEGTWRLRILADVDNLRAAFSWAVGASAADDRQLGLQIVAGLASFVTLNRSIGVGAWALQATELVDDAPPELRSAVLAAAGWATYEHGDNERAEALADTALSASGAPSSLTIMYAYATRAATRSNRGDLVETVRILAEGGTQLAAQPADAIGAAYASITLESMTAIFLAGMEPEDASRGRTIADHVLRAARAAGMPSALTLALYAWGFTRRDSDPEAALSAFDESVAIARAGASDNVYANTLSAMVRLLIEAGDVNGARRALRDAIAWYAATGVAPQAGEAVYEASTLLAERAPEVAARLVGSMTHGPFAYVSGMLNETQQARLDHVREVLGERLGQQRYEEAVEAGGVLSRDEVAALVLQELDEGSTR